MGNLNGASDPLTVKRGVLEQQGGFHRAVRLGPYSCVFGIDRRLKVTLARQLC